MRAGASGQPRGASRMKPFCSKRRRLGTVRDGAGASRSQDASLGHWIDSDALPSNPSRISSSAATDKHPSSPPSALAATTIVAATAMSRNTARCAATRVENLHQWILAIKQPSLPTAVSAAPTLSDTAQERGVRSVRSDSATMDGSRRHSSASVVVRLPLEERIGLPELKSIMRAFQVPPLGADGQLLEAPSSESPGSGTADGVVAPLKTHRSANELSAIVADLHRKPHSAHPPDQNSTGDPTGAHSPAEGKQQMHLHAPAPALSSSRLALRSLSQEEFVHAIQSAVPSATLPEIQALLSKTISETQDTVSWNELTAFLVTRSRQKADLALENQRFVLGGPPRGMRFDDQHSSSITCVAVEPVRRLLVTGCSEGSVRAWSSGNDLAYRGLLLQVDKWIVGLHWGCNKRVLYVVTMDRWVYILDGTTYEVLRVYHGRGITQSSVSMTYANETIDTVHVGGVALSKLTASSARSYGSARLIPHGIGSPGKSRTPPSSRPLTSRAGSRESHEERTRRLLFSVMHLCRAVRPARKETDAAEHPRRNWSTQTGDATAAAGASASPASPSCTEVSSPLPTSILTTMYSLTTADAAEVLHQNNTPLTGAGRGPYVHQQLDECVLTALIDPVTATAFHESAFQEDVLLLGTSAGDVFLFQLAQHHHLNTNRVLVARHVFRRLHRGRVTKLDLLLPLHALVSSGDDGHVRVMSLVTGEPLRSFYAADLPEQHASVTDFDLHPQLKMLLTVGPERRALVWEWTQPSPIALLDPANSPCCGGAFIGDRVLTISRDGVLHVYDCKGFHLQQEVSLATAGSLDRFGSAVGATHSAISQVHVDEAQQRVLCFGHFPFSLRVKWQVSSGFPERYRGHHVPILTTLSSRPFRQVVTVGTDGVVMTWTPRTGANEFSFPLSNFSNMATASVPLRPTAVSMDLLQRRLLTGFAGGIMVVWNILNGQVERVLTAAAAAALPSPSSSPAASNGTARKRVKPMSGRGRSAATASVERPAATATAVALTSPSRDVTAVGSFLRHRSVSYIFVLASRVYVDAAVESSGAAERCSSPQLGEYSTTPASSWTVPGAFGDVATIVQLGMQLVGCATASGAVLVYNVLFDRQEGAPLWVQESLLSPTWVTGGILSPTSTVNAACDFASVEGSSTLLWRNGTVSAAGQRMSGSGVLAGTQSQRAVPGAAPLFLGSLANRSGAAGAAQAAGADPVATAAATTGAVVSRVSCLMTLPAVHPRLLFVGQEDGTVSFWHTLRRVCLGAVSLTTAAGVEDGRQGESTEWGGGEAVVDMDMEETDGQTLVFGDGEGKVHVCRLKWKMLADSHEQTAALAMPNLALYCRTPTPTKGQLPAVAASAASSAEDATASERALPVLQELERVHVFSSGLKLSGIRLVLADEETAAVRTAVPLPKAKAGAEDVGIAPEEGGGRDALSSSLGTHKDTDRPRLLIICTGIDHFVRVFTLAGVPIGELGMDEWDTARPSTFRFMGEPTVPPAVLLPCSLAGNFTWQQDGHDKIKRSSCYHDYLADLYATHHAQPAMLDGPPKGLACSGNVPPGGTAALRRTMGGTVYLGCPDSTPSRAAVRASLVDRPSPAIDAPHLVDRVRSAAGVDKRQSHGNSKAVAFTKSVETGTTAAPELFSEDGGSLLPSHLSPGQRRPANQGFHARLRQSTRHLCEKDRLFHGVLKHSYVRQLQNLHRQGHASSLLSFQQPPAALPELPTILPSTSATPSAAASEHSETAGQSQAAK
ncbi:hypothetical protein, conserved [Leishmania donovani]|uniref:Guanine nucleotide-binding protein subunit beta-like protein n=1 Tax=Leishmania donovani TaxID=5661 RepID=E9BQ29_LEIDO|nr:hypothetical protein, conserved [Leishmania donovani]CBZ37241.1 hypothetical protein, conserved [Leishmania donovani]